MREQADKDGFSSEACERFSAELPAYLEGGDGAEVLAHAAVCEFCQCLLGDMQLIRSTGTVLAVDEPPARVWANIRVTLVQEGIIQQRTGFWESVRLGFLGRRRWPAPVAAGILAAVLIVLFRFPGVLVRPAAQQQTVAAATQSYVEPADLVSLRQSVDQLEHAYQANASQLEPSLKSTYQTSLRSLDDEIRECRASMKAEPEDQLARQYLSSAYFQKAQLLRSALDYNLR